MASWQQFSDAEPGHAGRVRARFEAHKHLTMATVRAGGGPRISGTEAPIALGELYLGGMSGNRRFADLRRDPRVAIHSGSDDPDRWAGDAKVSGTAVELLDPAAHDAFRAALAQSAGEVPDGPFELFRVELAEAVVVRLSDDREHLIIETWREGAGLTRVERR